MKAVLQWASGHREQADCGGGLSIIKVVRLAGGRVDRVTFHHDGGTAQPWVYVEGERVDATEDMAKAQARNDARTWDVIRRGLDMDDRPEDSLLTRARRRIARWVRP